VRVDNANGQVAAAGLQFATDGYVITGSPLALVGGAAVVRVGDGTLAGTGMTATVEAALTGSAALVKADLGTLVLTGPNSYTGGTVIEEGTLQVSSDRNLGAAAGALTLDGGPCTPRRRSPAPVPSLWRARARSAPTMAPC
jgi:fibronectin-binding autotransporter adhesin